MTDHDPLCPESEPDPGDTARQHGCLCYLIGKVRADERRQSPWAWSIQQVVDGRNADIERIRAEARERIAQGDDVWTDGFDHGKRIGRADERLRIARALSFPAIHDKLSTYSYRKGFDDGRADAARIARGKA